MRLPDDAAVRRVQGWLLQAPYEARRAQHGSRRLVKLANSGVVKPNHYYIFDGITRNAIFDFSAATGHLNLLPDFLVPTGLLVANHPYFFGATSVDVDTTEPSSSIHINWGNRSREFLAFTPVPEPASLLLVGSCLTVLTAVAWRQRQRK